jgi:murein L,D-transpeptidase YafK
MSKGKAIATFAAGFGVNPVGHKQQQGDRKTPEGKYVLDYKNPNSAFYRSIHISYPNNADREAAHRAGVSPGGDIMIHGIRNGLGWLGGLHRNRDWTDGCIAVTNAEIREIWSRVPDGTRVEIRP